MLLSDRRRELGLSIDGLYKKSGVPRYRIICLEQGLHSLRLIPFFQCVNLCFALELPLHLWYQYIMSDEYESWIKARMREIVR